MSTRTTKPSVFFIVVMIVMLIGLLLMGEDEEQGTSEPVPTETAQPDTSEPG